MDSEVIFTHDKEYHDIVNNKESLRKCTEKFLINIIDELTLGIIFDTHRKYKTRAFDLDGNVSNGHEEDLSPNVDIFGQHNMKKTLECDCPNCSKTVAATRFAPHLAQCMGMGRNRSSRRIASNNDNNTKDRDSTSYSGLLSDDEDDVDWNSGDKRRKKKQRNGNKKGKGTPKKTTHHEVESVESANVDIEGDEEGDINLRDFLQDSSNHSSPTESIVITNNTSAKKKDKGKNKKNSKRDRVSPSSSITD